MIEPSVAGVLRSNLTIRRFYWVFFFAVAVGLVFSGLSAGLLPSGWLRDVALALTTTAVASCTVLMLIYWVWLQVTPPELRAARLEGLRSGEIAEMLTGIRGGASEYLFLGRSGSYFRAEVLPALDAESRQQGRPVRVKLVLPDAWGPDAATRYAAMMTSLGEDANPQRLESAVLATILAAAQAQAANRNLTFEVALSANVPVLRFDISSHGAVVTRDRANLPGIFCSGGSPYADMFRAALENEFQQGRRITWTTTGPTLEVKTPGDLARVIPDLPPIAPHVLAAANKLRLARSHRYAR